MTALPARAAGVDESPYQSRSFHAYRESENKGREQVAGVGRPAGMDEAATSAVMTRHDRGAVLVLEGAMTFELAMGFVVIVLAMMVHLVATFLIVLVVRPIEFLLKTSPYLFIAVALVLTYSILFMAHMVDVAMWAKLYQSLGLADNFSIAFYSAFIMNTTLGLGDIKPEIGTRLLAPLTASSGVLTIGWSTAVLVYIVQTYLPHVAASKAASK